MINAIVAATKENRALGKDGDLPWKRGIPEDLKHFHATTMGHPMIMGLPTYDSIPGSPLAGRTSIIISRDPSLVRDGAVVVRDMPEALATALKSPGANEIYVIGGEKILELARPYLDRIILTEVQQEFPGDRFLFDFRNEFNHESYREEHLDAKIPYVIRHLECAHGANAS